jgi:hypothetical protein
MLKPLVAITSLLAGGVAVAAIAHIQTNPRAFTSVREAIEVPEIERRFEPTLLGVVVSLPPNQAARPVPLKPRRQLGARAATTRTPCSNWRDLGPKAVARDKVEERRVRLLCQ